MKIHDHIINFPQIDGIKFYLAGGAVRDLLMEKKPKDFDFVMQTSLSFEEVLERIKASGAVVYNVKPEFQIILIGIKTEGTNKLVGVDLTFPRKDGEYSDMRHPDSTERTNDLKEDAARRDFTINSMFMDEEGEVYDYFNGIDDIEEHIIRAVGNPMDRFKEDPLRILRAMRFATEKKFTIEDNTVRAMDECMPLLNNKSLALDRMRVEVNKMLRADVDRAMGYLIDFGVIKYMMRKDPNSYFQFVQGTKFRAV